MLTVERPSTISGATLTRTRGSDGDRGSVLLLVPTAILIFVILGAIAVDSAAVFLGQRELSTGADAAANDAATALSDRAFYRSGGDTRIDPTTASQVVTAAISGRELSGVQLTAPPVVTVSADGHQVCVELAGRVHRIFGTALPGVASSIAVHAKAAASAVQSAGGTRASVADLCP